MKNFLSNIILAPVLFSCLPIPPCHSADLGGSNAGDTERVCRFPYDLESEAALTASLKQCKRGDILLGIGTPWMQQNQVAFRVCDFTKSIYSETYSAWGTANPGQILSAAVACVYTGSMRPVENVNAKIDKQAQPPSSK